MAGSLRRGGHEDKKTVMHARFSRQITPNALNCKDYLWGYLRTKEHFPDVCADQSLTRLIGPLRFSAEVGFLYRPSLACTKRHRHPASPASTRG